MRKIYKWISILGVLFLGINFSFCEGGQTKASFQQVDSLNHITYSYRYKNLDVAEQMAKEAFFLAENYPLGKAQALNHWGFCRFMKMDFEQSDSLFRIVYDDFTTLHTLYGCACCIVHGGVLNVVPSERYFLI